MKLGKFFLAIVLSLFFVSTSEAAAIRGVLGVQASESPQLGCGDDYSYDVDGTVTLSTGHNAGWLLFLDEDRDRLYAITEGPRSGNSNVDFRLALVRMSDLTELSTVSIGSVGEFLTSGVEAGTVRPSDGRLFIVFVHRLTGSGNACFDSERCINLHAFDGITLATNTDYTSEQSREMQSVAYSSSDDQVYVIHNQDDTNARLRRIDADTFVMAAYDQIIHASSVSATHMIESDDFLYFQNNTTGNLERIAVDGSSVTTLDILFDNNNIASFYHAEDVDSQSFIVVEDDNDTTAITEIVLVNESAFTINSRIDYVAATHEGKIQSHGLYDSRNQTIHSLRVPSSDSDFSIQRVSIPPTMATQNTMARSAFQNSSQTGVVKFSPLFNAIYSIDLSSPAIISKIGVCTEVFD